MFFPVVVGAVELWETGPKQHTRLKVPTEKGHSVLPGEGGSTPLHRSNGHSVFPGVVEKSSVPYIIYIRLETLTIEGLSAKLLA